MEDSRYQANLNELYLFFNNDRGILTRTIEPIQKNLIRRLNNQTYNFEKSIKLWRYAVDFAAREYDARWLSGRGRINTAVFPVRLRNELAAIIARDFLDDIR